MTDEIRTDNAETLENALARIEELEEENAVLKGRTEGFEKQILGLLYKYESIYKRFPDLKDAMNEAERVLKKNAELEKENAELKEKLDFISKNAEIAGKMIVDMVKREVEKAEQGKLVELVQEKYNLEYKIENLENKIEHQQEVIDVFKKKNAELKSQIEEMKCCGNCIHCKYSESEMSYEWCEKHDQIVNIAIQPCCAYERYSFDRVIKELDK